MFHRDLLITWGGIFRKYQKDQTIFYEGDKAMFYYEVIEGSVKMVNINEDGKEFIQGIFKCGESFGEPVLLIDEPYPACAVANEDCVLIRITRESFVQLLKEYPDIHLSFTRILAKRLYNKSLMSKEISSYGPEHRIETLLHILKKNINSLNVNKLKVDLSRQQIADMTGLRVETVIRCMKKMQEKGILNIEKGKVYY
jgi:CRP/FNR family transcriptional regulator